ncbi:hypothetical protein D3C75_745910 [compost metagenome]
MLRCSVPYSVLKVSVVDVSASGRSTMVVDPPPSRFIPFQTPMFVMNDCSSVSDMPALLALSSTAITYT